MGHDVTLFASGDSITSAKLAPMREQALRLDPTVKDWVATYYRMVELIYRQKDEFDILHFHIDYFPLQLFSRQDTPYLTTIHGRLDVPEFVETYGTFAQCPFVSISDSQRRPIPQLNWVKTVYHGMPAGMIALITGLQPILTAFAAVPLLGERVTRVQWLGLAFGFSLGFLGLLFGFLGTTFGFGLLLGCLLLGQLRADTLAFGFGIALTLLGSRQISSGLLCLELLRRRTLARHNKRLSGSATAALASYSELMR